MKGLAQGPDGDITLPIPGIQLSAFQSLAQQSNLLIHALLLDPPFTQEISNTHRFQEAFSSLLQLNSSGRLCSVVS